MSALQTGRILRALAAFGAAILAVSCSSQPSPQWLMPTPIAYLDGQVEPFAGLAPERRNTRVEVFYATNRKPKGTDYGFRADKVLHFGTAEMRLGDDTETWQTLTAASTTNPRPYPLQVRLIEAVETGDDTRDSDMRDWAKKVDEALRKTATRDIIIYVHGAKVGFLHSCAFAAELDHFAGKDFTPVAFDWPTHREIFTPMM